MCIRSIISITVVAVACDLTTDSVVTRFLATIDEKFEDRHSFVYTAIKQPYFMNVDFIEVDTFVTLIHPIPSREIPLRIAVDKAGNVYRLFGFDENEYNAVVASEPLALKEEDMYLYGEFVLDVTELWGPFGYMFIFNTDAFLDENRRRMKEAESGPLTYGCDDDVTWSQLEEHIRTMFEDFKWGEAAWCDADSVYEAEYMAWIETTGALRYFRLQIHPDGRCDKVADSVWSRSFGYYYKYQK